MEWNDTALVVRVGSFRESDMWVRLLCRTHGLITVFAFGGRRSRRRFCGCLDVLNTLLVRVTSTRNGTYTALQEGVLLTGPQRLRHDWQRLGMAMNCIGFLEALGTGLEGLEGQASVVGSADFSANRAERHESASAFTFLIELVNLLESAESVPDILPALFRLRYVTMQGFSPDFGMCQRCGTPSHAMKYGHFAVDEGVLFCEKCGAHGGHSLQLSRDALSFLRMVQTATVDLWLPNAPDVFARREALRVIEAFVQYHVGIEWHNGRFRKN